MPETITEISITARLFAAAGISRVVFVDDRHGITHSRVQEGADELMIDVLSGSGAFPGVDFTGENEDIKRARIATAIAAAAPEVLVEMFDKMAVAASGEYDAVKDKAASRYFESAVGTSVETVNLSLKEWDKHKDHHIAEAKNRPTLFIFDEDFSLEGQGKTHGRSLIDQTHAAFPEYKFIYALLTHNVQDDAAEIELQKTITTESPDIDGYVLVISKSRLSDGGDRFAQRMKHLLLYRLFATLKKRLREETEQSSKEAMKEIENLSIESFDRIILGTSRGEGAWSPDTLIRVIGVYQQQQVRHGMRRDVKLHEAVREIDPICEVKMSEVAEAVVKDAHRLQHDEIYEGADHVNAVHLPLASGDIFKDAAGQEYVLLAQPCDLMVRSNGRRKGGNDARQMVPLAPIRKPESKYINQVLPPEQFELPYYEAGVRWAVKLNEVSYLPIWLLDFSVLNLDGRCSISEEQPSSPLLISPWGKRLPLLIERAKSVITEIEKMNEIQTDKIALLSSYCRIPLDSPFKTEVSQSAGDNPKRTLALNLSRARRLSEEYASDLLVDYAAYLSRLAHPHDLTRLK